MQTVLAIIISAIYRTFLSFQANEKVNAYAKYDYDALGERIRFKEMGSYENKTFGLDALLLFREVTNTYSQQPCIHNNNYLFNTIYWYTHHSHAHSIYSYKNRAALLEK